LNKNLGKGLSLTATDKFEHTKSWQTRCSLGGRATWNSWHYDDLQVHEDLLIRESLLYHKRGKNAAQWEVEPLGAVLEELEALAWMQLSPNE